MISIKTPGEVLRFWCNSSFCIWMDSPDLHLAAYFLSSLHGLSLDRRKLLSSKPPYLSLINCLLFGDNAEKLLWTFPTLSSDLLLLSGNKQQQRELETVLTLWIIYWFCSDRSHQPPQFIVALQFILGFCKTIQIREDAPFTPLLLLTRSCEHTI